MSKIHKSQCPTEQLPTAIAWESLRHGYMSRHGWYDLAADAGARRDFYEEKLTALYEEEKG